MPGRFRLAARPTLHGGSTLLVKTSGIVAAPALATAQRCSIMAF